VKPLETLEVLVKTAWLMLLVLFAAIAGVILILVIKHRFETDGKISAALASHHPGHSVRVVEHREGPMREICFAYELRDREGELRATKVGMVSGDDDGGTWRFGSEYRTLDECEAAYYRG
jgi:hypothetical protein